MKKLQKIELIDKIGRELQERMKFSEIDSYFKSYGIPTNHQPSYNSKYVYVREVLPKVQDEIILEIATELGIEHETDYLNSNLVKESEATFWKPGHFKLFISHLASFKATIAILKTELEKSDNNRDLQLTSISKNIDIILTSEIDFSLDIIKELNNKKVLIYKETGQTEPCLEIFVPPPIL